MSLQIAEPQLISGQIQDEEIKNNIDEDGNIDCHDWNNDEMDDIEQKSNPLSYASDSFSAIDLSNNQSSKPPSSSWSLKDSSWDKYGYTKVYGALKDLEQFDVKISIPEFVFMGFQSSGKTSAVSQAAKIPVGVMKTGTASRCPTRFKLINNPKMLKPSIKVNGHRCRNVEELTTKCLEVTNKLEEEDKFSTEIIEVRIEFASVPELTFVDLPGLIRSDDKQYGDKKKKLDEITTYFIHQTNPDGSYRYIPILVREPYDKEHDKHEEKTYIDTLIETSPGPQNRSSWKDDTLFIVNKFDKQINRAPASSLIEYMRYCCNYGQTVLTIMNPTNDNCSNMNFEELSDFVQSVEKLEENEWQKRIERFRQRDDENLSDLIKLKKRICGVRKMNEILAIKMKEIVTKILPTIEKQLDLEEQKKQKEIARLIQQIDLCNPGKLKMQCIAFNNRFLQNMRDYYDGPLIRYLADNYTKSFAKEMNDFHVEFRKNTNYNINWKIWKYEIEAGKLLHLVSKSNTHSKGDDIYGAPEQLAKHLKLELIGSAAILRIINAWISMVSFMPFPIKTDQDIINYSGAFHSTQQPTLWTAIRNVVLAAVDDLSQSCLFLAELLRYRLHQDADIIFEYTLSTVFGFNTSPSNKYNLNSKFKHKLREKNSSQSAKSANFSAQPLLERTLKDYKKETDFIINEFKQLSYVKPQNQARILSKSFCEDKINIGQLLNHLLQNKDIGTKLQKQSLNKESKENKQNEEDNKNNQEDDENEDNVAYDNDNYDILFYQKLHGQKINHPIEFNSMKYDIKLIRHLSFVFWTAIKQLTIDDVTQKFSNIVMKHINQHDDRLSNAIQCGVDKQRLKTLIDQLVDQTGIDVFELEQLINKKKTLPMTKSLNDLTKEEIEKIYGVDRDTLIKNKDKKVTELQKFREAKKETLRQIHVLKNSQIGDNE